MEPNDIIFFLKSLRTPSPTFNILDYVSFCNSSTQSSSSHKLRHSCSSTTLSSHFYFSRLPRLWNSLPFIDPFNLPLSSVISHIKTCFGLILLTTLTHLTYAHFTSPVCALSVFTPSLTLLILLQQFNIILLGCLIIVRLSLSTKFIYHFIRHHYFLCAVESEIIITFFLKAIVPSSYLIPNFSQSRNVIACSIIII